MNLTDYFSDLATEAPHDLGLLSRVQARAVRRTRVRRLGTAVVAVAAVTAVVGAATQLPSGDGDSLRYTQAPEQFFEQGPSALVVPFALSRLLPGLASPPMVEVDPAATRLSYLPVPGGPGGNLSVITGARDMGLAGDAVQVRGHAGTVRCSPGGVPSGGGNPLCELAWQEEPGLYVLVQRETGTAQGDALAEVGRAASDLRRADTTFVNALTVRLTPRGCTRSWRDSSLSLNGPGDRCGVHVGLAPAAAFNGEPVTIGGRTGVRVEDEKAQHYLLHAASEQALDLTVPLAWSDELVDAFVAAISVAGE